MRVTIIPQDGFVSVDNEYYTGLDLSFMNSSIHAVQWYETSGEIELRDDRGRSVANEEFSDLSQYQPALDAWSQAKALAQQADIERQLEAQAAEQLKQQRIAEQAAMQAQIEADRLLLEQQLQQEQITQAI